VTPPPGTPEAAGLVDPVAADTPVTGLPHFEQNWASEGIEVPHPTQNCAAIDESRRWEGYGTMGPPLEACGTGTIPAP